MHFTEVSLCHGEVRTQEKWAQENHGVMGLENQRRTKACITLMG